jgi:hypothetical protein
LLSLVACCSKLGVLCCFFTLLFLLVISHTCCFTLLLALSFHHVAMPSCFVLKYIFGLCCSTLLAFLSYLLLCTLILMDWYSLFEFFCASIGETNYKTNDI